MIKDFYKNRLCAPNIDVACIDGNLNGLRLNTTRFLVQHAGLQIPLATDDQMPDAKSRQRQAVLKRFQSLSPHRARIESTAHEPNQTDGGWTLQWETILALLLSHTPTRKSRQMLGWQMKLVEDGNFRRDRIPKLDS